MQNDYRVPAAVPFNVCEIPKQELKQMHPVQESQINLAAENALWIM